jgi:hypothetical protein
VRPTTAHPVRVALLAVAGLAIFLFAVGCGSSDDNNKSGEALSSVGAGEGQLNIICWAG